MSDLWSLWKVSRTRQWAKGPEQPKKYCDVVDARTYIEKPFKDGNAAQLLLRKTLSDLEAAE